MRVGRQTTILAERPTCRHVLYQLLNGRYTYIHTYIHTCIQYIDLRS